MINPALQNLEKELAQEKQMLLQKATALNASATKITNLNNEIRTSEDNLRTKKAEIMKLEQDIKTKTAEVKRETMMHDKLNGEMLALQRKQSNDNLQLSRITREQKDAIAKAEIDKRRNAPIVHN